MNSGWNHCQGATKGLCFSSSLTKLEFSEVDDVSSSVAKADDLGHNKDTVGGPRRGVLSRPPVVVASNLRSLTFLGGFLTVARDLCFWS